eukprot:5450859-Karenia_brevis.AAC.1
MLQSCAQGKIGLWFSQGPSYFCNLHYIRWDVERAAHALAGLSDAIQYANDNTDSHITPILAADLNITSVQDSEGLVGPCLLKRPKAHTAITQEEGCNFKFHMLDLLAVGDLAVFQDEL